MTLLGLACPAFHALMQTNKIAVFLLDAGCFAWVDSALFLKGIQRNRFFQKNEN